MDEETADELIGGERHVLVSIAAFAAVVLPFEGNATLVAGDQAAVGDGDTVGVARQIGQHRLRPTERTFGVDDPFGLAVLIFNNLLKKDRPASRASSTAKTSAVPTSSTARS